MLGLRFFCYSLPGIQPDRNGSFSTLSRLKKKAFCLGTQISGCRVEYQNALRNFRKVGHPYNSAYQILSCFNRQSNALFSITTLSGGTKIVRKSLFSVQIYKIKNGCLIDHVQCVIFEASNTIIYTPQRRPLLCDYSADLTVLSSTLSHLQKIDTIPKKMTKLEIMFIIGPFFNCWKVQTRNLKNQLRY